VCPFHFRSVENVVEFVSAVGFSDQSGSFKDQVSLHMIDFGVPL